MISIGIDAREFCPGRMTGIGRYLRLFIEQALISGEPHEYILFGNQFTQFPHDHPRLSKVIIKEKITIVWDQVHLPLHIRREKIDVLLTPYFKAPLCIPSSLVIII